MDSEPVARALLVTGVTYVTVGLVTLSLGIIFLVVELHDALLAVWSVAIASGVCSIVAGGLLASLSCNQRSARPASLISVICFTFTIVLTVGTEVALLVLSTFHVLKDEKWKEIYIFFIASSGIQLVALVLASLLLLTCNERIINEKYRHRLEVDPQDNYGFIGDSEMWCSARAPRGQSLVRWPGLDRLDAPVSASNPDMAFRSSSSSVGSVHPGHYIAGDHHPRYIAPSSTTGESGSFDSPSPSDEADAGQTEYHIDNGKSVIQAEVHGSPTAYRRHEDGVILSPQNHAELLATYAKHNGVVPSSRIYEDEDEDIPPIPARRYHVPNSVPMPSNGRPRWHSSSPTRPSSRLDGYDRWNELIREEGEEGDVGLPSPTRLRSRSTSPVKTERNGHITPTRSSSPTKARASPQHPRDSRTPSPWRSRPPSARDNPSNPTTVIRNYSPATSAGGTQQQTQKRIFLYNPLEIELPGMTQPQRKKGSGGHVSPGASPTFHTWSIDRKSLPQRRYVNGSGVPMTTGTALARPPSRVNGHSTSPVGEDGDNDNIPQPWPHRKDIFSRHNFHNASATSLHSLNQPTSTLPNGYKYNHLIPRSKAPPPPPTRHASKRGVQLRRPRDPPPAVPAYVTRRRQYYDPNFNYRTFSDINGVPLGHVFTVEGWKGMNGHHIGDIDGEMRPRKVTFMEADV